ncbi:MAG: hypothetical protein ACI9SI_000794 [Polaribacter sp.]|jgi:hypothetical protein
MTFKNVQKSITYLSIIGLLLFVSCQSSDENIEVAENFTTEEALNFVLADDISAEVDDVLEDDAQDYNLSGKSTDSNTSIAAKCAVRTVEVTASGKIVTLDFGTGCEGRKGKELAGKIIIEYVRTTTGFSKTVSFENFTVEGNAVEGGKSIAKLTANANGNPEATFTFDITITLTTGEVIIRKGTKVNEKIAGADTKNRGDDVYSISGNWESVNKDGVVKNALITVNLRREYACKYIVSGVIEITKDTATFTLYFGDGTCDNLATLTDSSGAVREITLKKNKRKK